MTLNRRPDRSSGLALAIVAFVPFLSVPFLAETRELPRWTLLQLLAFFSLAYRTWRSEDLPHRAWRGWALAFGAALLVSSMVSESPLRAVFGAYDGHTGMLSLWTVLALAACAPRVEKLPQWIAALTAIGVGQTLIFAVAQFSGGPPIGTLGHVLFFAEFLTLSIIAASGWIVDAQDRRLRALLVAASSLMIGALAISGRRTSLLALALGLGFMSFNAQHRRRLLPLLISGAISFVVFSGLVPNPLQPHKPLERWGELFGTERTPKGGNRVAQRIDFYRVALLSAPERPILGHGFGSFRDLYASRKSGRRMPAETNVHSVWLDLLLSAGAIGLVPFIGLMTVWIALARRRIREERTQPWAGRIAACGGIGLAHLLYLSFNFEQAALAGWAWSMAGVLIGSTSSVSKAAIGTGRRAFIAVTLAFAGLFGAERLIADHAIADCLSDGIIGRWKEAEPRCDLAIAISPYECTYRIQLASLLRGFDPTKAEGLVRPCLELEPRNADVHRELGRDLLEEHLQQRKEEGVRELERAADLAPFFDDQPKPR